MKFERGLFWFRRDLRLNDNHGLFQALQSCKEVVPVFIYDTTILDDLENPEDARINFISEHIHQINNELKKHNSSLVVLHGDPLEVLPEFLQKEAIEAVFTNHDYEPSANKRDEAIASFCKKQDITFNTFKDQVVFEKDEVMKDDGDPYTVFTPYSKKWKTTLNAKGLPSFPSENHLDQMAKLEFRQPPTLESIGFKEKDYNFPSDSVSNKLIQHYKETRDFPAQNGTSRLSVHLRFGTISIRELFRQALKQGETYVNELIWREFYMMILHHFPYVVDGPFKKKYATIKWQNDEEAFERWKIGNTGIPIVDAGMRELTQSGYMHNRVRMIVASFLCKNLLIDWRWGEAYFAEKLLDFELSSNNGGWQWVAGCGCDGAPYFRIFNPITQAKKFDPDNEYIKKWVPEFGTDKYPEPMIDLKASRQRCLDAYKNAIS